MSRAYEFSIEITGFKYDRASEVWEAVTEEWPCEDDGSTDDSLYGSSRGSLRGGMTADEMARKITWAAWKANGAYCRVAVGAICLEDPDVYVRPESEYDQLKAEGLMNPDPVKEEEHADGE